MVRYKIFWQTETQFYEYFSIIFVEHQKLLKIVFNISLLNVSKHLGAHGKFVKVQAALYLPSQVQYGSCGQNRSCSILLSWKYTQGIFILKGLPSKPSVFLTSSTEFLPLPQYKQYMTMHKPGYTTWLF